MSASIVSSRGCPLACSYCSVSATSSHPGFRQRPVDAVVEEIQHLVEDRNTGFIDFEDENLTLEKPWAVELFTRLVPILAPRNVELRAMNGLYPPSLDAELIRLMKAAGFKTLNLSLGTTNRNQLMRFKRADVRPALEKVLALAVEQKLDAVSYIIGAAPGQSADTSL